ncbi:type II toxin-antitoxin system VapC family toxin, partial [Zooshikella ganghwensis]|uniref:type II toxin-antitoxin system VapC family toxin n=1 Tax=Zooshikella ganghwensis TaxID=202772 RepID=UPI000486CA6F
KESGFVELPVKGEHTEALLQLPPIHKDPFDRLLVAQAITEPMKLMTADNKLDDYSELIWKI